MTSPPVRDSHSPDAHAPEVPETDVPQQPPTTPTSAGSWLRRHGRQFLLDTAYCVSALPLTLAAFVLTWFGLGAGVPLVIVWVGLPILFAVLLLSSALAQVERWRLREWLGHPSVRPGYLASAPQARWFSRLLLTFRDPQRWLDVLWSAVAWVPGLIAFTLVGSLWGEFLGGVTYSVWRHTDNWDITLTATLLEAGGQDMDGAAVHGLVVGAGLLSLLVLPWVTRAAAWGHGAFSALVLNSRADLSERVRRADGARAAAQQAEAASFRRLERDIHDGPQQRLVRLTMDLGRAKRQISQDPALAEAAVDDALRQAREALDELRALSRGIAPPLLVDRGLGVALDELVVRSAVPVRMEHDLPAGLSPHVETAVYFTVSEALTNVAKHSGAALAVVSVAAADGELRVRVSDEGVGGAHPGKGQGLAGLEQRLRAVEGTLDVTSPVGGGTVLDARIPLT